MNKSSKMIFLNEESWFDDLSNNKYRFIHLTLNTTELSLPNLFVLAASRLHSHGEFIIRFRCENTYKDFEKWAEVYEFSIINKVSLAESLYVFNYEGDEKKLGYDIALADGHTESCMELYKEVFKKPISKKYWNWKYPRDKATFSGVALKNNKVLAHFGLCSRLGIYNHSKYSLVQSCDVMVAPKQRGGIVASLFYELVKLVERPLYFDIFPDENIPPVVLSFGFPHGRHYKLGARLKLYTPISPIFDVIYNIPNMNNSSSNSELVESYSKAKVISALKLMYKVENTLILERDYLYLLERYIHHPEFKYKVYYFQDSIFIIRPLNNRLLLMDYWGDLTEYATNLSKFVKALSTRYSGYSMHLWCLEDIAYLFIDADKIDNTGAYLVYKDSGEDAAKFDKWWITMGDTEFL